MQVSKSWYYFLASMHLPIFNGFKAFSNTTFIEGHHVFKCPFVFFTKYTISHYGFSAARRHGRELIRGLGRSWIPYLCRDSRSKVKNQIKSQQQHSTVQTYTTVVVIQNQKQYKHQGEDWMRLNLRAIHEQHHFVRTAH